MIDDKDVAVRDSTLHCLGILKGLLGDEEVKEYYAKIEARKLVKIDDAAKSVGGDKNENLMNVEDITKLDRNDQLKKTHFLKKLQPILDQKEGILKEIAEYNSSIKDIVEEEDEL